MFNLFQAEFKRIWKEFIRYPVDAISGILVTSFFFYGMFFGAHYIAGPNIQFGDRLDTILAGYVLWTLVVFILQGIAMELQVEAQTGTLEQIFLSPFGTLNVLLIRAMANLTLYLVLIVGILLLTMILTGRYLHFSPLALLPLITVLLGAYGISLMMAGLTLLFKRIQQLSGLIQFALLFLLALPTETWNGSLPSVRLVLPMTVGSGVLRDLIARDRGLDFSLLAVAGLNGVVYFVLGAFLFLWAQRTAKRHAILNGY
ncbi:ABC transporter permease [Nostoc sp.]|uniref:ABC transporter permease n=1 Tax=Nostoc sp. TaxID=1180 RepID=UPI002FFD4B81